MITYATVEEAERALGRAMTWVEAAWFRHSGSTPDYCLYFESLVILIAAYSLTALPLALFELCMPALAVQASAQVAILDGDSHNVRYNEQIAGIRTGLPLPSAEEVALQLLVYMLMEDYLGYWLHRLLHCEWAYDNIHYVHHEYPAPMGFAAGHSHWAELLILGFPAFFVTIIVPCHMATLWLWYAIRAAMAVETHSGFDFPFSPTKLIPFYGGVERHDYHHSGGRMMQSNFAPLFVICDYIYGTDDYRHHRASLVKLKDMANISAKKEVFDGSNCRKKD
ncbi:unnamed protein product [Urochloa decumbens]|uniref:aldehyde oxygenase (deformylating) n=1 Tax=Urochloa decumbens TaxID=240449 RepID=A0ABC9H6A3_9POAL